VAAVHERLVVLVADRVEERDGDGGRDAAERAPPQEEEQAVGGGVDQLAPDRVPHAEAGVEVGLGAEEEDQRHQEQGRADAPHAGMLAGGSPRIRTVLSITSKSPYALRALAELARSGGDGPVPIGELARRRDIPVQFLEQLFAVLRRAGILRSQRGVKGGYSFARDPSQITVLELVELLDGPVGGGAESIFAEAAAAARAVLAKATINDVVERENREAGASMYYI